MLRSAQEKSIKQKLREQIDFAISFVEEQYRRKKSKIETLEFIKKFRFGENKAYIWVHSFDNSNVNNVKMLMHPTVPKLNGKDISQLVDKKKFTRLYYNGKIYHKDDEEVIHIKETRLFVEMNRVCRDQGGGIVEYYWPKPLKTGGATEEGYLKFSYVKLFPDWNWVLGTGEYVDFIDKRIQKQEKEMDKTFQKFSFYMVVITLGILASTIMMSLYLASLLFRPIKSTEIMLQDVAQGEGDLTKRLEIKTKDEIGNMANWFNIFIEKIAGIISNVVENILILNKSSQSLITIASELKSNTDNAKTKSKSIAESSNNVTSNIQTIASALEEMSISVQEISKNTSQASNMALDAVNITGNTQEIFVDLNANSKEIGNIMKIITTIAEQTNLLALNANIEAARAGEAGKGFAVVANEVKELAKKTSDSTEDINNIIKAIQSSTDNATNAMDETSTIIKNISDISNTIANAVEEQSATTEEISHEINKAASSVSTINENINLLFDLIQNVSSEVSTTEKTSDELKDLTINLEKLVNSFKI